MYFTPKIEECIDFAKALGAKQIREIVISPRDTDLPFLCHKNCEINPVLGYYIVKDDYNILHAFKHSVLNTGNKLIDVTPTLDNRKYNIFCFDTNYKEEHITYIDNTVFINRVKETEMTYYVYGLIDPRDNQVFYIGKGKDDRALSHFKESELSRSGNNRKNAKIRKLKKLGYSPVIEFYAQNIEDESLAYDIETSLIKKYGRIDYEEGGMLTNICEDNRPPNHKGKTYEEIYGDRAKEQKNKRRLLQLAAGGWYKNHKHSEETLNKLRIASLGKNNPRYGVVVKGTETANKIGRANKGKKHYTRIAVKLLYIDGLDLFIYSNDLRQYCINNNLSYSTFCKQLYEDWPRSKRGKNIGLLIRYATQTEITSYVVGGINKDVTENTFANFKL
jgi:NUMOD3 motif